MASATKLDPRLESLLLAVEQAYDRRAWHGPNLKSSLRSVTPDEAAWRPQPERHNVWELTVHAAYWKYRVLRKLADDAPASFAEAGSNFFERPPAGIESGAESVTESARALEDAWERDRQRLDDWHHRLIAAIRAFGPERLDDVSYDRYSHRDLILGAAAHDVYHAGQIRLLRTMWADGSPSRPR